jgi:hypothetical protein
VSRRTTRRAPLALSIALCAPSLAHAQDASTPPSDAGAVTTPEATGPATTQTEPPADPAARIRRAQLPQPFAAESPELPAGTILVRVLDAQGQVVPDCLVRVGSMREGERGAPVERRTGPDGLARFDNLERGTRVAYRVTTEHDGAKFGADPFQLPPNQGYQVQLVRLEVSPEPRGILVTEARVEIGFQDDRLVLVQRFNLVNISALGLDNGAPRPFTWALRDGIEFTLPQGYSAFRADEQSMGMSDLRVEEREQRVRVTGSLGPTDPRNPVQLVWQSRVKFDRGDVPIELTFPSLPVLAATVVTQAPPGMTLDVEGMPPAQERNANGQRILITGRQRANREDPSIGGLRIRLRNIPSTHGPERDVIAVASIALALASVVAGARRARSGQKSRAELQRTRRRDDLHAERERVLEDVRALAREHTRGDVGPETYRRQRLALASELAAVDRALAALDAAPSPQV